MAFLLSGVAQAQLGSHGVAIGKACGAPVRTCTENSDCEDGNECTSDVCDLNAPDTVYCEITVSYNDTFGDVVQIQAAWDIADVNSATNPTGSSTRVPAVGNLPIGFVSGVTTCVPAGALPCTIGPSDGVLPAGSVTFVSNEYVPQPGDISPLPDRGFTTTQDQCNGTPDINCPAAPANADAPGQISLVSGCSNPPEPASTSCTDTGNECAVAGCDGAGVCDQNHTFEPPSTSCTDTGNECAVAGCDGAGTCDQNHTFEPPSTACTDTGNLCFVAGCDGAGVCNQEHTPEPPCPDNGLECYGDPFCDPATGCQQPPEPASTACTDTGNDCAIAGCDGQGTCDQNHTFEPPSTACEDTGNVCFEAGCDGSGTCDQEHTPAPPCDDPDCESCDPVLGCIPIEPEPAICMPGADVCRTPGFWKLHAGEEKKNSRNVAQEAIDWAGGSLDVCGTTITNTDAGNANSAVEAMCISVEGEPRLQLIRQLTAAALNCAVSGGGPGDCTGITSIEDVYNFCNDACEFQDSAEYSSCIDAIDEWNNGLTGNLCHDQSLCPDFDDDGLINGTAICLEPHGPAGSNKECKEALNSPILLP